MSDLLWIQNIIESSLLMDLQHVERNKQFVNGSCCYPDNCICVVCVRSDCCGQILQQIQLLGCL